LLSRDWEFGIRNAIIGIFDDFKHKICKFRVPNPE
jgi:hypothetical protein